MLEERSVFMKKKQKVKPTALPKGIVKMAILNTSHVTKNDACLMDKISSPCLVAMRLDEGGSIFWVPSSDLTLRHMLEFGYSAAICEIMRTFWRQGVPYVMFDCDGEKWDEFPTFDW